MLGHTVPVVEGQSPPEGVSDEAWAFWSVFSDVTFVPVSVTLSPFSDEPGTPLQHPGLPPMLLTATQLVVLMIEPWTVPAPADHRIVYANLARAYYHARSTTHGLSRLQRLRRDVLVRENLDNEGVLDRLLRIYSRPAEMNAAGIDKDYSVWQFLDGMREDDIPVFELSLADMDDDVDAYVIPHMIDRGAFLYQHSRTITAALQTHEARRDFALRYTPLTCTAQGVYLVAPIATTVARLEELLTDNEDRHMLFGRVRQALHLDHLQHYFVARHVAKGKRGNWRIPDRSPGPTRIYTLPHVRNEEIVWQLLVRVAARLNKWTAALLRRYATQTLPPGMTPVFVKKYVNVLRRNVDVAGQIGLAEVYDEGALGQQAGHSLGYVVHHHRDMINHKTLMVHLNVRALHRGTFKRMFYPENGLWSSCLHELAHLLDEGDPQRPENVAYDPTLHARNRSDKHQLGWHDASWWRAFEGVYTIARDAGVLDAALWPTVDDVQHYDARTITANQLVADWGYQRGAKRPRPPDSSDDETEILMAFISLHARASTRLTAQECLDYLRGPLGGRALMAAYHALWQ